MPSPRKSSLRILPTMPCSTQSPGLTTPRTQRTRRKTGNWCSPPKTSPPPSLSTASTRQSQITTRSRTSQFFFSLFFFFFLQKRIMLLLSARRRRRRRRRRRKMMKKNVKCIGNIGNQSGTKSVKPMKSRSPQRKDLRNRVFREKDPLGAIEFRDLSVSFVHLFPERIRIGINEESHWQVSKGVFPREQTLYVRLRHKHIRLGGLSWPSPPICGH